MAGKTQSAQADNPRAFRASTRQQIAQLGVTPYVQFGQMQSVTLPAVGLLANLFITMQGVVTTGAGTPSGSFPSGYPESPWNIIKNIRLHSTAGVDIINCSGRALAAYLRMTGRTNYYSANVVNDFLSNNQQTAAYTAISGAAAASTPYPAKAFLKIPIMTDDWLMWGMLLLQNDNVRLQLDVTLGTQADICGAISGVSLTPSFNMQVAVEFFGIDENNPVMPNLRYVRTLIEEIFPFQNTGDIIYQPPRGNVYLGMGMQFINNGASLSQAYLNNTRITYAQNVTPYQENYQTNVLRAYELTGAWVPDGYVFYDFSAGYGVPEITEPRDFMDTAQQTDFRVTVNATGFTPTSAFISVLRDQIGEAQQ